MKKPTTDEMGVFVERIERFLSERTPEERDRVIQLQVSQWFDHSQGDVRFSGPACLVSAAFGMNGPCALSDAAALDEEAAFAYDDLCILAGGRNGAVPIVKRIAARLNGSDAETIRSLMGTDAGRVEVGG